MKGDRDAVAAGDALLEDAAAALDGLAESENDEESEAFYAEAATDALDALRKALEERQLAQALNGPFDACACRLEVQAGAGGLDAQDWTAMVARMYARFCDARGLQCRELERAEGDHPGCVKSVTLQGRARTRSGYYGASAALIDSCGSRPSTAPRSARRRSRAWSLCPNCPRTTRRYRRTSWI